MKAVDFIFAQPWAMLPEHVTQMIAIAERDVDVEAVAAKLGRPLDNARKVQVRDGVAVIPVRGVISRYANLFVEICDGTSVDVLARDFRTALDAPDVRAIVLEIDSPGGQAAGIGELAGMIREGTKSKPVVCYVSHLGASAGYWLASAGSEVVAAPSAILGSVGVVLPVAKASEGGRTIEFVSSQSPNKRPNPGTESGRANIQAMVDAMADVFIRDVAANRGVKPEQVVSDFGAGGLKVGQAAVDAGMADRLGSLEHVISELSRGGRAGSSPGSPHGAAAVAGSLKGPTMKVKVGELFAKWFGAGQPETMEVVEAAASETASVVEPVIAKEVATVQPQVIDFVSAREADLAKRLKAAEDRLAAQARAAEDNILAQAESWFMEALKAENVTPAEKDAMVAAFLDYAKSDVTNGNPALASVGGRLGLFKAGIEGRKPHGLTKESIPSDPDAISAELRARGLRVMDNAAPAPEEAQAAERAKRVNAMLAATEAGADLAGK